MLKAAVLALLFLSTRAIKNKSSHFLLIDQEEQTVPAVTPILGATVTQNPKYNLANLDNKRFTLQLNFGSQASPAAMVLDLDSDWTIVSTRECDSCGAHSYNSVYSTTKSIPNFQQVTLDYIDAQATGIAIDDRVCINSANSNCLGKLEFLAMKEQTGLGNIEGLIGLSPDINGNPSFIQGLYDYGIITYKAFGLLMGNENFPSIPSQIAFGGYDKSIFQAGLSASDINYYFTTQNDKWIIETWDVNFGYKNIDNDVRTHAIFDSYYHYIGLPDYSWKKFVAILNTDQPFVDCTNGKQCFFAGNCMDKASQFSNFTIQLYASEVYHIPPLAYLDQEGGTCYLTFSRLMNTKSFVLGNTFLFNFYTIYDLQNIKVGIIPHQWSVGMVSSNGIPEPPVDPNGGDPDVTDPTKPPGGSSFPVWAIVIIVIAALVILVGLGVFSFMRFRKGKAGKNTDGGAINEEILE